MSYNVAMMRISSFFLGLLSLGFFAAILGFAAIAGIIGYYSQNLPDHEQLKDYQPPVVTRIYAGDGRLLAEYAQERRVFIPIEEIPHMVRHAFISAEDKNFYAHAGVDHFAIARAVVTNIKNLGQNRRPVGASTITQQVAKNFLLTNEVSFERKIKEAILATRLETALSKDRLLELYLNEIYLGRGNYGVAAAALYYFNKSLDELDIHEAAYLAALPKAPNNYHPIRNHDAAKARRDWVIRRMAEDDHISEAQAELAEKQPLQMSKDATTESVSAPYFSEEIRRQLQNRFGDEILYEGGLAVRASVDARLQAIATQTLQNGLIAYDQRHGWRGPVTQLESLEGWQEKLSQIDYPENWPDRWRMAVVIETHDTFAKIGLSDGEQGQIAYEDMRWARQDGQSVNRVQDALKPGMVIPVEALNYDQEKVDERKSPAYGLRQVPKVSGALIAMDPHTGRVLALQGGWQYGEDQFNRATQAWRQPGSAFKPFVYLSALDKGFTPATMVMDAPFVAEQGPGLKKWRPKNYSNEFYGPTPIRVGLEKSRNLMTVRLADFVGMETVADYAEKFGIVDKMEPYLSKSLGADETTLLRLTAAYAMLVNGGKRIEPTLIDRIQDRRGKTIFSRDLRPCRGCGPLVRWEDQPLPGIPDTRERIADSRTAYQIVSMLEGVVLRGTGRRAAQLGRPVAGKTGTTNESKDTWFIGFTPDMVVGVFIGFDDPKPLGRRETGSSVALPVFVDFMEQALADVPPVPFRVPDGIRHIQVNAEDGTRAEAGDQNVIWEAFVAGREPDENMYILDGAGGISLLPALSGSARDSALTGTGGLY